MLGQICEKRFHAFLVMFKPNHILADFRAVSGDGVMKRWVAKTEVADEILAIKQEAGLVNQLIDV